VAALEELWTTRKKAGVESRYYGKWHYSAEFSRNTTFVAACRCACAAQTWVLK
jgi:hypothetical protein